MNCVGEVLEQRGVRRIFDKALHVPIPGTPAASISSEELRVDLLFLDDIIALRAMHVFSKYSLLVPVRSKNPHGGSGFLL